MESKEKKSGYNEDNLQNENCVEEMFWSWMFFSPSGRSLDDAVAISALQYCPL